MSWTLETPEGRSLGVSSWEWRPTLELLERAQVLDAETVDLLGINFETTLNGGDAGRIAAFLDSYLPGLGERDRVRLDGEVTDEPDTRELHRDDLSLNYSASAEWLHRFRDFCRSAPHGFTCT